MKSKDEENMTYSLNPKVNANPTAPPSVNRSPYRYESKDEENITYSLNPKVNEKPTAPPSE